ncbi:MAG: DegT/DnrJ/EryC1/StrS family aminotransferase [Bacteroidota bacterium]
MRGYQKIQIPFLPQFNQIKKYLKVIDETKIYSNFGNLYLDLKFRLENYFHNCINTVLTSSCTSALTGAILAKSGYAKEDKNICIVPSYTFVGTIAAIISAGYTPFLFETEEDWDMDMSKIEELSFLGKIGLIVPVSIYGKNVDIDKWEFFTKKIKIPVVIDAAASFDTISPNYFKKITNCVLCVSLHATKSFGIGEGGFIIFSKNENESKYIRAINFGFYKSRDSIGNSINGKMSEYHAAVGLAALDAWEKKRNDFIAIRYKYLEIAATYGIPEYIICGDPISLSYCLLKKPYDLELKTIENQLRKEKIDYRLWYERGIHKLTQFSKLNTGDLTNSNVISESLVGIPMHLELKTDDIKIILGSLKNILTH